MVVGVAAGEVVEVVVPKAPDDCRHARTEASWAAVSGGGFCTLVIVCPPVVTVSVWAGTVPVSCRACRDRPGTAEATPLTEATSATAALGKVMSVPGTKKSYVNCVPAGPSLDRSVSTDELALRSAAWSEAFNEVMAEAPPRPRPAPAPKKPPPPPPPPPPKPPPVGAVVVVVVEALEVVVASTVRVTMMSVPTEESGERILFWAWVRPSETPTIPMTSPTPAARPMAVTTVRLHRLRSSFHAYPTANISTSGAPRRRRHDTKSTWQLPVNESAWAEVTGISKESTRRTPCEERREGMGCGQGGCRPSFSTG